MKKRTKITSTFTIYPADFINIIAEPSALRSIAEAILMKADEQEDS